MKARSPGISVPGTCKRPTGARSIFRDSSLTFECIVAEDASVVSIHRAEAEKVAGGSIAIRVFARFVIDNGKIVLCDELTHLEKGAAEDRDLASRK
jgi:hypothetical protein